MYLHANAKLGLAGRLAVVRAIEEGLSIKAAAAAFSVAGDRRSLVASLAGCRRRDWCPARPLEPSAEVAAAACGRAAGADLRLPPSDRLGSAACCRRDRVGALDGLEGAAPAWPVAPGGRGQGAGQQL